MTAPYKGPDTGVSQSCPSCLNAVSPGFTYCPSCGTKLADAPGAQICSSCGATNLPRAKFCISCGTGVGAAASNVVDLGLDLDLNITDPTAAVHLVQLDEGGNAVCNHPLHGIDTTIGRENANLTFADDTFQSPLHAQLTFRGDKLELRDLGSRNGTWMFLEEPHLLQDGDRILIGSQVIAFRRLGYPGPHPPEMDATRRLGSLVPSADIASLTQLRSDGSSRDALHLSPGRNVLIGREQGDWTFPYDPSMSGAHAEVRSEDADFALVDVGSRNGTAVAVRGERVLTNGSRFLVGDKMLKVERR